MVTDTSDLDQTDDGPFTTAFPAIYPKHSLTPHRWSTQMPVWSLYDAKAISDVVNLYRHVQEVDSSDATRKTEGKRDRWRRRKRRRKKKKKRRRGNRRRKQKEVDEEK